MWFADGRRDSWSNCDSRGPLPQTVQWQCTNCTTYNLNFSLGNERAATHSKFVVSWFQHKAGGVEQQSAPEESSCSPLPHQPTPSSASEWPGAIFRCSAGNHPPAHMEAYISTFPCWLHLTPKRWEQHATCAHSTNCLLSLQVSKIAAYAYSAISQIKVDAKEELVVQFAIPWFCFPGLHTALPSPSCSLMCHFYILTLQPTIY